MIEIVPIGIGGGTLLGGALCALDSKELGWVLVSIIGLIILIIGIMIPITNDSDCRNYCNCRGQYHHYDKFVGICECSETSYEALQCVSKCGSKDSHYNEFNGRCYCT